MPRASTREHILDVAERLFASRGYKNVSVRDLTAAAEVNLASVRYYFGSKDGLLYAIYERYCRPLNSERLARLAACSEGEGRSPLLEQIVAAFLEPSLDVSADAKGGGARFTRLRAILVGENLDFMADLIALNFDDTSHAFIDAIHAALPERTREEVLWRFSFLLGIQHYMLIDPGRIRRLSRGLCDPADTQTFIAHLIPFVAAGFRVAGAETPAPPKPAGRRKKTG